MRAGPLDRRIAIQRRTTTITESGDSTQVWAAVGSDRWASKLAVAGAERFTAEHLDAQEQVEFRLRWSDDLADLAPIDRIVEPAGDASTSPVPTRSIYDIFAVLEIGRHEVLRVLATRQTVAT